LSLSESASVTAYGDKIESPRWDFVIPPKIPRRLSVSVADAERSSHSTLRGLPNRNGGLARTAGRNSLAL